MGRLLQRLKIAHKLLIANVVLALPVIAMLYWAVAEYSGEIHSTRKEIQGAQQIETLQQLADDVRAHQRLAYLASKGDLHSESMRREVASRIDKEVSRKSAPHVAIHWEQIRTGVSSTPAEIVAAHQQFASSVRDKVREVATTSRLLLDPVPDSHYLVEAGVRLLPKANETTANAAMLAEGVAMAARLSESEALTLAVYAQELQNFMLPQVREAVESSLGQNSKLREMKGPSGETLPVLLRRYQSEVAGDAEQMRRFAETRGSPSVASQLAEIGYSAGRTGVELKRSITASLSAVLEERVSNLYGRRAATVGAGTLALALAFLIAATIARGITVPLEQVMKLASDVARGRVREASTRLNGVGAARQTLDCGRGDEIHELMGAVAHMTRSLDHLLTERECAQEILRQNEERYRTIFASAAVGIANIGPDGRWLQCNDAVCAITGYSSEELAAITFADITHPDDVEASWAKARRLAAGEIPAYSMEQRYIRKDGSLVWVNLAVSLLCDSSGAPQHYVAIIQDIGARKQAEDRFRLAVEAAPNGMLVADSDGRMVLANSAIERLFGYSREEIIGQPVEVLLPNRLRDLYAQHRSGISRPVLGIHELPDFRGQRKDGSEFPIEIGLSPIQTSMGVWWLSSIVDMTERERMEQERVELLARERALAAESALREAELELARVARALSVGELATSIAHEVNQPLAGVVTNAEAGLRWLDAETPNLDEARQSLALVVRDGRRASGVIRRIREFLNKGARESAALDINNVIREAVALARGDLLKRRVSVRLDLSREIPFVLGDRIQLQQVVLNLIMNGAEAMASTERPAEILVASRKSAGPEVLVAVRDSGAGIQPADMRRMFDAFFTTKPNGMGMGLPISRSILETHGGRIWVETNDGAGLTVQFSLPADSAAAESRVASCSA